MSDACCEQQASAVKREIYSGDQIDHIEISPTRQMVDIYFKGGDILSCESKLEIDRYSINAKIVWSGGHWATIENQK